MLMYSPPKGLNNFIAPYSTLSHPMVVFCRHSKRSVSDSSSVVLSAVHNVLSLSVRGIM